ncbi:MAG: O-antigen ligase family protein [Ilyomonas sp.]
MKSYYRFLNYIFLAVLFSFIFGTPLRSYDNYFALACIFISIFFIGKKLFSKSDIYFSFVRTILLLFLFLLFNSIIASWMAVHQSPLDSLKANIAYLQLFLLVFYAFIFSKKKISIEGFKKAFIVFIFLELIFLVLFQGQDKDAVKTGDAMIAADHVSKNFIRLGVMCSFSIFLKKGKTLYGLIAIFLLCFPNIISDFQRAYFTIALMMMGLSFILVKKTTKSVNQFLLGGALALIFLIVIVTFNFSNGIISTVTQKYSAVIAAMQGNKQESDPSVRIRFWEAKVALQFFKDNPLIGSGRPGPTAFYNLLGRVYYPADVGVVGVLGTFGIIGFLIYGYLFFLAVKLFIKVLQRSKAYSAFTIGLTIYCLNLAIESLQTGVLLLRPAFFLFIYLLARYSKQTDEETELENVESEAIVPYEETRLRLANA